MSRSEPHPCQHWRSERWMIHCKCLLTSAKFSPTFWWVERLLYECWCPGTLSSHRRCNPCSRTRPPPWSPPWWRLSWRSPPRPPSCTCCTRDTWPAGQTWRSGHWPGPLLELADGRTTSRVTSKCRRQIINNSDLPWDRRPSLCRGWRRRPWTSYWPRVISRLLGRTSGRYTMQQPGSKELFGKWTLTVCHLRRLSVNLRSVEDSIQHDGHGAVGRSVHGHQGQVVLLHQAVSHRVRVRDGRMSLKTSKLM